MNYCKNCGKPLDNNTKFCPNCGKEAEFIVIPEKKKKNIFNSIIAGIAVFMGSSLLICIPISILISFASTADMMDKMNQNSIIDVNNYVEMNTIDVKLTEGSPSYVEEQKIKTNNKEYLIKNYVYFNDVTSGITVFQFYEDELVQISYRPYWNGDFPKEGMEITEIKEIFNKFDLDSMIFKSADESHDLYISNEETSICKMYASKENGIYKQIDFTYNCEIL